MTKPKNLGEIEKSNDTVDNDPVIPTPTDNETPGSENLRWNITRSARQKVLEKVLSALDSASKPRDIASLTRCLTAMDHMNQSDHFFRVAHEPAEDKEIRVEVRYVDHSTILR